MRSNNWLTRRRFVQTGTAAAALIGVAPSAFAAIGKPEKSAIKLGVAVDAASFLPAYVGADAHTWKDAGLDVEMTVFRGDAEVSQAMAGDSIDISLQSLDGLLNLINSGQPAIGFYAGFYQADFAWYAQPSIKSWKDMKGSSVGISTFGSLTESLTRYALSRHGFEAMKDVELIQVGPTSAAFQAMKAGRLGAAILSPPFKWTAAEQGFTLLGNESEDVAKQWPKHIFVAKRKFLDENPNTVKTFLRGHVNAIRYAHSHPAETAAILGNRLKYDAANADRAYKEMLPDYNERGTLPDKYMDVFWKIEMAGGQVKEAWPDSKLLDDRFVKTFDDWSA